MSDLSKAEQDYHSNAEFRALVDTMIAAIMRLEYSPAEMRTAAMFACIRVEQIRPRPSSFIVTKDDAEALGILIRD